MLSIWQTYSKEIVSVLVPITVAIVGYFLRPRAKMVWSVLHNFVMITTEQWTDENGNAQPRTAKIVTTSVHVENFGRDAATGVEIVLNWRPPHFNTWPQRHYEAGTNPEGRYVLKFGGFAPKEWLRIELLSISADNPEIVAVRFNEGLSSRIETRPQKLEPRWKMWLVIYLMLAGIFGTVYVILSIFQATSR
jgi:hypothetical protein